MSDVLFRFSVSPQAYPQNSQNISYSQLLGAVDEGRVREVLIQGPEIHGTFTDGRSFQTYAPGDPSLVQHLYNKGVSIKAVPPGGNETAALLWMSWLPFVALIGVWIFLSRRMQGSGGNALAFRKSRAKLLPKAHGRMTFEDVAGVDEAKRDLQEIVDFLRDPGNSSGSAAASRAACSSSDRPAPARRCSRARSPARPTCHSSPSPARTSSRCSSASARRVRDMFDQAKKNAPCIVFIDEIDAVGRARGAGLGGGNDEREQTLNQLLVEMDGFAGNEGIVLAATNRPDVLDPALLRPGRFDRHVVVQSRLGRRESILKVHVRKVPLAPDVDSDDRARHARFLGRRSDEPRQRGRADGGPAQQADGDPGRVRGRQGQGDDGRRAQVAGDDGGGEAPDRLSRGRPCHRRDQRQGDRSGAQGDDHPARPRAGHGHAIAGARQAVDEFEQMTARLAIMMGGRVAEELVFGHEKVTSGAASDIEQATKLARMMVTRWGLSDTLGTVAYGENQEEVFLGYSVSRQQNISEATVQKIDAEIRRYVEAGYQEAQQILTEKRADLETLAKGLLKFETLSGDEIKDLLMGKQHIEHGSN